MASRTCYTVVVDLVQSAALFRKAAGVYHYLANEVFPTIRTSAERTPECTSSVSNIMSLICLAEAQVSFCNSTHAECFSLFSLGYCL